MGNVATFLRCPYCGRPGAHSKKVSKSTGTIRVKVLPNNVWICKCAKCSKVFRTQMVGSILAWNDMSEPEKKAWKQDAWINYKQQEKVAEIVRPKK